MNELVGFFRDQAAAKTVADCAKLAPGSSDPVKIDYHRIKPIDGGFTLQKRFSFEENFDKNDYTIKNEWATELSPLSQHILRALNAAKCDLSAYAYEYFVHMELVVPRHPWFGHLDNAKIELSSFRQDVLNASKVTRVTWANMCSTATMHPAKLMALCPEGFDRELFFGSVLAYRYRPAYIQNNLKHSNIAFASEEARTEFGEYIERVTDAAMKDDANYTPHDPSRPVFFSHANVHSPTCIDKNMYDGYFGVDFSNAEERCLVTMRIYAPGARVEPQGPV